MGLPMPNIHAPTVESGPTTNEQLGTGPDNEVDLKDLIARKEDLEAELSALGSVLDSHGVNMNTTLTTFDGFPRADIDVAQIRTTRARIIHLRNDYKALMSRIESGLHAHFAAGASTGPTMTVTTGPAEPTADVGSSPSFEPPFAMINTVVEGGPADTAGLKAGDKLQNFGGADWLNHEKLSRVAQIVSRNEGRPILVKVLRNECTVHVTLVPRKDWGGRGLLGCHLLPV